MNIVNWEKMWNLIIVIFIELDVLIELFFYVCSYWDVRVKSLLLIECFEFLWYWCYLKIY